MTCLLAEVRSQVVVQEEVIPGVKLALSVSTELQGPTLQPNR